jgi:hypothetical protein
LREALDPEAPRPGAGGRRVERLDLAREAQNVTRAWNLERA